MKTKCCNKNGKLRQSGNDLFLECPECKNIHVYKKVGVLIKTKNLIGRSFVHDTGNCTEKGDQAILNVK